MILAIEADLLVQGALMENVTTAHSETAPTGLRCLQRHTIPACIIADNLVVDFMVRAMGNQINSSWLEPVNDFITAFSEFFDYDAAQDPGGQKG